MEAREWNLVRTAAAAARASGGGGEGKCGGGGERDERRERWGVYKGGRGPEVAWGRGKCGGRASRVHGGHGAAAAVRGEERGAGWAGGLAAGLGPAGARVFFKNVPRKNIRGKIIKRPKNIK